MGQANVDQSYNNTAYYAPDTLMNKSIGQSAPALSLNPVQQSPGTPWYGTGFVHRQKGNINYTGINLPKNVKWGPTGVRQAICLR